MEKVIAVVVTYNRREQLSRCINALRSQSKKVDKILVINNGSTDNTQEWLNTQIDIDFITQKNVGGAGGFATGIKTAFERKYSWIWLMDDDGYPKEDALENLLAGDDEQVCLRNCAVVDIADKKTFVWKTGIHPTVDLVHEQRVKDVAHPFNGTLLHRKVIERVGFPKDNLFLWGDETEYLYRIIKKYKIPCYTKTDSIHYHPLCTYSYKNDWTYSSNWKMYYYVRNRFFILKTKFSSSQPVALFMYFAFLAAFAGTILLYQKTDKFKKLGFILWPMKDAFSNNTEATPTYVLDKLSRSFYRDFPNYFIQPLKYIRTSLF